MSDAPQKPPRSRKQPLEKSIRGRDFVVICVSTYPRELEKLDAMVAELRSRGGKRRMTRSALIRLAIEKLRVSDVQPDGAA